MNQAQEVQTHGWSQTTQHPAQGEIGDKYNKNGTQNMMISKERERVCVLCVRVCARVLCVCVCVCVCACACMCMCERVRMCVSMCHVCEHVSCV